MSRTTFDWLDLSAPPKPTAEDLRKAEADAEAARFLAEMHCPEDVTKFGERHGIPALAEMTWLAGFQAGWRAYHSRHKHASLFCAEHRAEGGCAACEARFAAAYPQPAKANATPDGSRRSRDRDR